MNAHDPHGPARRTAAGPDDVWGGNRPPVLGPPTGGPHRHGPVPEDGSPSAGPAGSRLDGAFAALRSSPLRRDSVGGIVGGVCAGIAARTGAPVAAVRIAAGVLALFFGAGAGAYLLAWAVLPDQAGRIHAQDAVRGGGPGSMVILALGALAALGTISWLLDSWWLLVVAAVVAYGVLNKSGCSAGARR